MSLVDRKRHGKNYYYFRKGTSKYLYLGPTDDPAAIKQDKVIEALEYTKNIDVKNIELESNLLKLLSVENRDDYVSKRLAELDERQHDPLISYLSEGAQKNYLEKRIAELQTRLRQPIDSTQRKPGIPIGFITQNAAAAAFRIPKEKNQEDTKPNQDEDNRTDEAI